MTTIKEVLKALGNAEMDRNTEFTEDNMELVFNCFPAEDRTIDWASGASKLVILLNGASEVVKIPFRGQMSSHYDENEEYDGEEFYEFEYAGDHEDGWNYCEAERIVASAACDEGLEQCFAITRQVMNINGYPVYIQERATVWANNHSYEDYSEERRSHTSEKCKRLGVGCFNSCWLSDFLDYFGEEIFQKFMRFVENQDIGDLHGDNLGYIGDRPVLIDYSGFWD